MSNTASTTAPRPAGWLTVDEGQFYEGPTFYAQEPHDAYGVAVMSTPDGYAFALLRNTFNETMTRTELEGLRTAIDDALRAEAKLD